MNDPLTVAFMVMVSKSVGLGHLKRCEVVMHCLQAHNVTILKYAFDDDNKHNLELFDETFTNYDQMLNRIKMDGIDILIIDTPPDFYNPIIFCRLKTLAVKLVLIDDDFVFKEINDIDLLIACSFRYNKHNEELEKACFGTDFIILRDQFILLSNKPRIIAQHPQRLLLSFGGSDPNNISSLILSFLNQGFEQTGKLSIQLVLGQLAAPIHDALIVNSPHNLNLVYNIDNMADAFIESDIAIISGGMTLYEACCSGTPTLVVNQNHEQNEESKLFAREGAILNGGRFDHLEKDQFLNLFKQMIPQYIREALSTKSKLLIDGNGSERIVERILGLK